MKTESIREGTKRAVGEQVYDREGLSGTRHAAGVVLKPATEYYWTVRVRRGESVSEWSRYDYTVFLVLSYTKVNGALFRFRTPDTLR